MRPEGAEAERLVPVQLRRAPRASADCRKRGVLLPAASADREPRGGPEILVCAPSGEAAAATGTFLPVKTLFLGLFQFGAVEGVGPVGGKGLPKAIPEPLVAAPAH